MRCDLLNSSIRNSLKPNRAMITITKHELVESGYGVNMFMTVDEFSKSHSKAHK